MPALASLAPTFVDQVPDQLEEGRLYIAIGLRTMVHRCACGCGREVVTPIGPMRWRFTYDGAAVSVRPSIGNWSLPCRSHYWIDANEVRWAPAWSDEEVLRSRARDRALRIGRHAAAPAPAHPLPVRRQQSLLRRIAAVFHRRDGRSKD